VFQKVLVVEVDFMKMQIENVNHVLLNAQLALALPLAVNVPLDFLSMVSIVLSLPLNFRKSI
jgi:hypothetical protein